MTDDWRDDIARRTPAGWYGLAAPKGWNEIVRALHEAIVALFPDYEVYQIKEKFGTLRYYCSVEVAPGIEELIRGAEELSEKTCQACGKPGTQHTRGGWVSTLCDECVNVTP